MALTPGQTFYERLADVRVVGRNASQIQTREIRRFPDQFFSRAVGLFPTTTCKASYINKIDGRGGGDRIHELYGNKGVLRRTLAF